MMNAFISHLKSSIVQKYHNNHILYTLCHYKYIIDVNCLVFKKTQNAIKQCL